jgi:hypothetical protein
VVAFLRQTNRAAPPREPFARAQFSFFVSFANEKLCGDINWAWIGSKPAIAQLVEHLTVDRCSNQMVPGSIPGGRMCVPPGPGAADMLAQAMSCTLL